MKKPLPSLCLCSLLLLCGNLSHAEDNFVYGSLGSGNTQVAIGFGHIFDSRFSGRIALGKGSTRSEERNLGANSFKVTPPSNTTVSALVDWFPIPSSGFRLSGGLTFNNRDKQDLLAKPDSNGNYTLNGHSYTATSVGTLSAQSRTGKVTPEISLGWESAPASKAGWRLTTDLNLSLNKPHSTNFSNSGSGNAALLADLASEQKRATSDWEKNRFRLGIAVGAAYSF